MADDLPDLTARLRLDTSDIDRGVSRAAGIGSAIGTTIGTLGANLIQSGLTAVGDFLSGSIDAARESAEIGRATEAILKATGGAAGVTASQVSDLAGSLSQATGIDDELIQTGENLLLTFRNVKNAGEGTDAIFDRATGAALDLSKAGFGSVESASTMLGKALNDPIAGMTALGRAGVTFSDQQKEQIKGMVESGDLLGAQRTILDEVANQVGGVAAATADPMAKAQVAIGNFQEQIGGALLPILGRLADFAVTTLLPALQTGFGWIAENVAPILDQLIGTVGPALSSIASALGGLFSGDAASGAQGLLSALEPLAYFFTTELLPRIGEVYRIITELFTGLAARIAPAMPAIQGIMEQIGNIITSILDIITTAWDNWGEGIMNVVGAVFNGAIGIIGPVLGVIQGIISFVLSVIQGDWSGAWLSVQNILRSAVELIQALISGMAGIIGAIFGGLWARIVAIWESLWATVTSAVANAWASVVGTISAGVAAAVSWVAGLPGRAAGALGSLAGQLAGMASGAMSSMGSAISSGVGTAVGYVAALPGRILGAISGFAGSVFNAGWNLIQSLAEGIRSGFQAAIGAVQNGLATVRSYLPFSPAKRGPFSGSGYPLFSGRAIGSSFAQGITDSMGAAVSAARTLAAGTSAALDAGGTFGVAGAGGGGAGRTVLQLRVFLGDRELTDLVRVEVDGALGELGDTIEIGAAA